MNAAERNDGIPFYAKHKLVRKRPETNRGRILTGLALLVPNGLCQQDASIIDIKHNPSIRHPHENRDLSRGRLSTRAERPPAGDDVPLAVGHSGGPERDVAHLYAIDVDAIGTSLVSVLPDCHWRELIGEDPSTRLITFVMTIVSAEPPPIAKSRNTTRLGPSRRSAIVAPPVLLSRVPFSLQPSPMICRSLLAGMTTVRANVNWPFGR